MELPPRIASAPAANSAITELRVTGMTCNNCARHVTEAIQGVAGVQSAAVSLQNAAASVRWNSVAAKNVTAVLAAVAKAGYAAKEISPAKVAGSASKQRRWEWTLIVGLAVTGTLMIGEWVLHLAMSPWFQWLAFALAGVVQAFCGAQFYRGAWRQLKIGSSNMDTLVALGSTTAFGYSTWVLFSGAGGHVYFMEAAAIISLISAGHWVEARVSDQASGALKSLLNLAPPTARRIQSLAPAQTKSFDLRNFKPVAAIQTAEVEIPVSELKINDRIALRPGDRVPVDGVVVEGESAVDEAMLTGESIPADKKSGSELFAGTVNLNGRLVLRVTATGETTALAHIIAAVQRAQTSRAGIQRLGDRISNVFVPIIVGIALAAGIFWAIHSGAERAFVIAAGVLIVACPCAMGLATPAAIMAAANAAARRGILIRDGIALEKAGNITAIVFDKTGTLTEGRPKVVANKTYLLAMASELRSTTTAENLAASLASLSSHPLSKAVEKASAARLPVKDFKEFAGRGIVGMLESGHLLRLGSFNWFEAEKIDLEAAKGFAAEWANKGATVIGFAVDDRLVSVFALQDALKTSARKVISRLRYDYLPDSSKIYLVSGDSSQTVHAIARQLDIPSSSIFAEVRPEQKAEFVKRLQSAGERVAFVGDGINDAPALTQADLGIAVSRASDVAREAADIILLKSEIEAVPEALGLARATLRTIKQNLFWAFFYNALGVPLAACGIISPIFCAAAMGFSDLIVIGNALRLLRWRK
jgi:Cu+-exporting ATPase